MQVKKDKGFTLYEVHNLRVSVLMSVACKTLREADKESVM